MISKKLQKRNNLVKVNRSIVNILWTGGWDSTFRVLQLLLQEKVIVQPFYLMDVDRLSTGVELRTMRNIKSLLFRKFPYTSKLLLPTKYLEVADIRLDAVISKAFNTILTEKYIGSQYDWIARFCKQEGINNIELCIHLDDKAHDIVAPYVKKYSGKITDNYRYDLAQKHKIEYVLFRYYSFPLFNLSKIEMHNISRKYNWDVFMDMTWFCHRPRNGTIPCGNCNPCRYTMEEGLGWRIPLSSRLRGFFSRTILKPMRKVKKMFF